MSSKILDLFLTGRGFTPKSADEAYAAWNDGKEFKMYRAGTCTVRDFWKLKAAGATRIGFVCQRDDMSVFCAFMEVAEYKPPIFRDEDGKKIKPEDML